VLLATGEREIIPWSTSPRTLRPLEPELAAIEAGMPAPSRLKVAGGWRRIDPFHSERHLSPRFRALTALIYALRLPCRYSLIAFALDEPFQFTGPCAEDPEQTAGNLAERLARDPSLSVTSALHLELLADAGQACPDPGAAQELLDRAEWSAILADLELHLARHTAAAPAAAQTPDRLVSPSAIGPEQLSLFQNGGHL
jgi:hypothetical protein